MPLESLSGLLNFGAIGSVLAWMLWRSDSRLERIERSLDRLTRAQMLLLVAQPDLEAPIKAQAHALLREMGNHPEAPEL